MRLRLVLALLVLFAVNVFFVFPLIAATDAAPPQAPDWSLVGQATIAALLPVLTYWIRLALPRLPRSVVWMIPPLLGAVATTLSDFIIHSQLGGAKGLLLGLVAIALRELRSTLAEHGVNG